ncbi:MAG: tetratricopeptide repeat protein [Bacteroidales bacterium]|nr:tetratricopeptide repeat protein [Bacteroidales bacterium]
MRMITKILNYKQRLGMFFMLFVCHSLITAQDQVLIDSLKIVIEHKKNEAEVFSAYRDICDHYMQYDFAKALEYAKKAYDYAVKEEDVNRQVMFLHQIGNAYLFMGNYKRALEHYFQGLKLLEDKPDHFMEFALYNNIGGCYDRIRQYDLALEYQFKALELFNSYNQTFDEQVNKANLQTQIFNNIGNYYEVTNDNDKALQYYNKALKVKGDVEPRSLAQVHNNLGKLYHKIGNWELAKYHLQKGLKLRLDMNDQIEIIKSYIFIANLYRDLGQLDSSLITFKITEPLVQASNSLELKTIYHSSLSQYYGVAGQFQAALDHHINYERYKDSLMNQQSLKEISNLEAQQKIDAIEGDYKLQQQKDQFQLRMLIFGLVTLAVVSILIIILFNNQRKRIQLQKESLEKDLNYRNKEMATNVMYLVRKNELINNVAKRLLNLKENLKNENKGPVSSIIYELQTEVDNEVWTEFEMRFQQVHSNFYDNLRDSHPDLTPSEERLCAFLRLNMSSKEIAAITHQNAKSIEVARARLRKKLNLTGTDTNLLAYLSDF